MTLESRKIIKLGPSSMVITLPRKWIRDHNIKPGDMVMVIEEGDGSLRLLPLNKDEKFMNISSNVEIKFSKGVSPERTIYYLLSLYSLGYDKIVFTFEEAIPADVFDKLYDMSRKLSGVEIVEYKPNRITFQVIIEALKIDLRKILQKIFTLLSDFLQIVNYTFDKGNTVALESSLRILDEIMRIVYLFARSLYTIQKSWKLLRNLGFNSPIELLPLFPLIHVFQTIGRTYTVISNQLLNNLSYDIEVVNIIKSINNTLHKILLEISDNIDSLEKINYGKFILEITPFMEKLSECRQKLRDRCGEDSLRTCTLITWYLESLNCYKELIHELNNFSIIRLNPSV